MLVAREVAALRMSRVSRGIPLGREIPNVEAPTRAGGIGRSADLRQRVLLFVAPDCESCHDLVNEIRVAEMSLPLTVAVTSRHEIAPTEPFLDTLAFLSPSHVWVDSSRRIFGQFEAPVTPFAYAIDLVQARLIVAGTPVVRPPEQRPWGRTAAYRDPDENTVSLTETPRG